MWKNIICHKASIISLLIILATILQFAHESIQQKLIESKDAVFNRSIEVVTGAAALASNSADILLQRDLIQTCYANNLKICGSSEFLLKENVLVRDGIRAYAYEAPKHLEAAQRDYNALVSRYNLILLVTSVLFYIFLILAIFLSFIKSLETKDL